MRLAVLLCVSSLLVVAQGAPKRSAPQDKIKHVVVLMEENRSFDHMCGFFDGVDGLTGKEYNLLNVTDPTSKRYTVNNTSPYVGPFDPDHSLHATTDKIFGVLDGIQPTGNATMSGFAQYEHYHKKRGDPSSVLNMFTPERLPVLHALYQEFNLFDKYFCSVPGPTWPNRLFQLLGSSKGDTKTKTWDEHSLLPLYGGRTIFSLFEEAGYDWKFYFDDAPLELAMVEGLAEHPLRFHDMARFRRDAAEGTLPTFAYMNPRWFVDNATGLGSNDQHPDHDVALGERLIKDVYETLRASPQWNNTLFIVTYDEHGGFYDHVSPPAEVPPPDNCKSFPFDFDFDRSGVRIPTLLISPWVEQGRVIHEPAGRPGGHYELTSVISTMRELFGLGESLTARDAWAPSFADAFSRDTPRDCPMTLPDAPPVDPGHHLREAGLPLNDLQKDIVQAFARLRGETLLTQPEALPQLQGEAREWAGRVVADILHGKHAYTPEMKQKLREAERERC